MQTVSLPSRLYAGDSLERQFELPEYPASDGWVLRFVLVSAGAQITFSTVASGAAHALSINSAVSGTWVAGRYRWQTYVERLAQRTTLATGEIEILPDLAAATAGLDTRTHVRRTLDNIEAVIEGRASSAVASYQIAGRELRHIPIPELLELRDRYRRDARAEDAAQRLANGQLPRNKLFVRL
jgi:hypothetical protein